MKVEAKQQRVLTITDATRGPGRGLIDPITVLIQNVAPGQGHLTVTCYGEAWTCWWGSMGDGLTVEQFIARTSIGYITGCLVRGSRASRTEKTRMERYLCDIIEALKGALQLAPDPQPAPQEAANA
jgi:hypothetical protein